MERKRGERLPCQLTAHAVDDDILARVQGQRIVRRGRPFPEYPPWTITK